MANIPVGGQIQIADNVASVDAKYGLYNSKQEAFDALGPDGMDVLAVGLTVGIMENGKVVEYWFESACDSTENLVKKGGSTGGSIVSVTPTLTDYSQYRETKAVHFIKGDNAVCATSAKTPSKILGSNRFNIETAKISNNWSSYGVTVTKTDTGISIDNSSLQDDRIQKNQFVTSSYTAEYDGDIWIGCNVKITSGSYAHTGFGCYVRREGSDIFGTSSKPSGVSGKGFVKMRVQVKKGDIVTLVFYASKAVNKHVKTNTLYSDIMISYANIDTYVAFNDNNISLDNIKKGCIVEFNENTELSYYYKEHKHTKKLVCFGDSITGMFGNGNDYPFIIGELSDIEAINCGFSGSQIADHKSSNYKPFSLNRLVDAVIDDDFTSQNSKVETCGGYYPEHLENLKAVNFYDVDYVTIFIGTNDWGFNAILRSKDDTSASSKQQTNVEDATKYVIEKLQSNFPHLRIILITPIWRNIGGVGNSEERTDSNITPNDVGDYLYDYVNVMRECARMYNVETIDNYWTLGINALTSDIYLADGTHPTYNLRKIFAEQIINRLSYKSSAPFVEITMPVTPPSEGDGGDETDEPTEQTKYIVTVSANNDEWGIVTGGGTYSAGTSVTITATPNAGYKFVRWSDDSMDSSLTITVDGNRTLEAIFEAENTPEEPTDDILEDISSRFVLQNGYRVSVSGSTSSNPGTSRFKECNISDYAGHDIEITCLELGVSSVSYAAIAMKTADGYKTDYAIKPDMRPDLVGTDNIYDVKTKRIHIPSDVIAIMGTYIHPDNERYVPFKCVVFKNEGE